VPFRNAQTHFEDILQSIDHIDEFLAGIDFDGYREDRKTGPPLNVSYRLLPKPRSGLAMRLRRYARDQIGRDFAGWGIFFGMCITGWMTRSCGIR